MKSKTSMKIIKRKRVRRGRSFSRRMICYGFANRRHMICMTFTCYFHRLIWNTLCSSPFIAPSMK
eukprot:UN22004